MPLANSSSTGPRANAGAPAQEGAPHPSANPSELLQNLLESFVQSTKLQGEVQTLFGSMPQLFSIAGGILEQKEAGEKALNEAVKTATRVLSEAKDRAADLSKALQTQETVLDQILQDETLLVDVLKTGSKQLPPASRISGSVPLARAAQIAGADPRIAKGVNDLKSMILDIVQEEVRRTINTRSTPAQPR
ncbi:hypothetical protein [Roseibium litorale]|uniref:Phasin family protein n=1 Tax=Roseibium litorale TaxID=2803841 RepID=A0ABR9CI43_9HYPH|nr:hypothetical protein [Roseibium litorale]MBD8890492.1 hypothetical protein [Roseibium litorale]